MSAVLICPGARASDLETGFRAPPAEARPRVWWHWLNGNVTEEGIKLDLEWMKRVGIGGFQYFDADLNTPQFVEHRIGYMSDDWRSAFSYATRLAESLGLEEGVSSAPGWSETGGPWVKPGQAMKKFVWSETRIHGGGRVVTKLKKPSSVSGPFQDVPVFDAITLIGATPLERPEYYHDAFVIAYRTPPDLNPKGRITTSDGSEVILSSDGRLLGPLELRKSTSDGLAWVAYEYPVATEIRAVSLQVDDALASALDSFSGGRTLADLEASSDGQTFHLVAHIPGDGAVAHTVAFPAVSARFFRIAFKRTEPTPNLNAAFNTDYYHVPAPSKTWSIRALELSREPRVNRFEDKAGFSTLPALEKYPTPHVPATAAISDADIVDVTEQMRPDGTFNWRPPAGDWVVLRFGYSLTGASNHTASREGLGLEVDKLSKQAVRDYMTAYLGIYHSALGADMGSRGLRFVVNDSWEAGAANWTDDIVKEFARRRGYDLRRWAPVLAGRVVGSSEASDKFLWDFRRTLGDLLAEYHYDQITEILHERGMGHYGESHEEGRAFIGDGMEAKRSDDIPMGAMWTQNPGSAGTEPYGYDADLLESASVAHIYGKSFVGAESFTTTNGAYVWSPATLKPTADKEMALGVNRFVIHTSVHQPFVDKKPGLSLPFGQWFTRNETWADQAGFWIQYLSRSSFLLQQGRFVADVAYFYGEDSNLTAVFGDHAPAVPEGYAFDYVNADALIHEFSAREGELATRGGMSYRILALDPRSRWMSLTVLRKLAKLVRAGAVIVGKKPAATPSLSDNEREFRRLADALWSDGSGVTRFGLGRVFGDGNLDSALRTIGVKPDFSYESANHASLAYSHRSSAEAQIYFVANRTAQAHSVKAIFRVFGREAEIWHADSGAIDPASYEMTDHGTDVSLQLEPREAVFVVFRAPTQVASRRLARACKASIAELRGDWLVSFEPMSGAAQRLQMSTLSSWITWSEPAIRYFSGTARYFQEFQALSAWFEPGAHLLVDLGDVRDIAQVYLNGKNLGVLWTQPFQADVTGILVPGSNHFEVRVINGWANRLIGDHQTHAGDPVALTWPTFYSAESPLMESGLLGPVKISRVADCTNSVAAAEPRS